MTDALTLDQEKMLAVEMDALAKFKAGRIRAGAPVGAVEAAIVVMGRTTTEAMEAAALACIKGEQ